MEPQSKLGESNQLQVLKLLVNLLFNLGEGEWEERGWKMTPPHDHWWSTRLINRCDRWLAGCVDRGMIWIFVYEPSCISVYECRHKVCVRNCVTEAGEHYSHRVCGAACAAHPHIDCYKRSVASPCSCHYLVSVCPYHSMMHATSGHIFITLKDKPYSATPRLENRVLSCFNKNSLSKNIWMWQVCRANVEVLLLFLFEVLFSGRALHFFPPRGCRLIDNKHILPPYA